MKQMTTLEKVKQWFIDRDLENGGRLDKQSLKLSEEFGELCAGYLKKNEQLTKDSIGDCTVVIVGLALLIKEDVQEIFEGDIVRTTRFLGRADEIGGFYEYEKDYLGVVKVLEGSWVIDTGSDAVNLWSEIDENEVLGNIYESLELLEDKE
jgi:uncharacterized phage protein (TIGR01671 family)